MIHVSRDNEAACGDLIAHYFRCDLLAACDELHFFRDPAKAGEVHLRKIPVPASF